MSKYIKSFKDKLTGHFSVRFLLCFTAMMVLVFVALSILIYSLLYQKSVNDYTYNISSNLRLVNLTLQDYFDRIERLLIPDENSDQIVYAAKNTPNVEHKKRIDGYLRTLAYSQDDIEGVYFYILKDEKYYYIDKTEEEYVVRTGFNSKMRYYAWFQKALLNPSQGHFQALNYVSDTGYFFNSSCALAYHKTINDNETGETVAVVSIYFSSDEMNARISNVDSPKGAYFMLLGKTFEPYYISNTQLFYVYKNVDFQSHIKNGQVKNAFLWNYEGDEYYTIFDFTQISPLKLIMMIPMTEVARTANSIRGIIWIIGSVFTVLIVVVMFFLTRSFTRPLESLTNSIVSFGEGNLETKVSVRGHDELAILAEQFNLMAVRINHLITEKYELKLEEKRAILRALEAEINPHFLYNALQAISTEALKDGNEKVYEMVNALAATFRYCLNDPSIVMCQQEIQYIRNYLLIQKARFGERLQVDFFVDETYNNVLIPKLSVQSLVENAVKHALERSDVTVTIVIRISAEDETLLISVENNGPDIPYDRLQKLRRLLTEDWNKAQSKHKGLKNIDTRLQMMFGEESRLHIHSKEGYTRFFFRIPISSK